MNILYCYCNNWIYSNFKCKVFSQSIDSKGKFYVFNLLGTVLSTFKKWTHLIFIILPEVKYYLYDTDNEAGMQRS